MRLVSGDIAPVPRMSLRKQDMEMHALSFPEVVS